ncbi:VCBS repeat-containing protein [Marivivens sp. JLT3646]|uniref:FG-GAP repeat domain-containing protein n=1 Tax=Marivivens sp. JLT3646 TaxID=1920883 RepID=UPI0007FEDBA4|nr:VCBS repeat-containing protein [Marivivens sp. JLT3646]APO85838.1 hypothetical protein BSK21_01535 [Marivivens sp. JLT3646]OBR37070.1 hypothetical protein A9199_07005 [Donghicola sp. JL3646]
MGPRSLAFISVSSISLLACTPTIENISNTPEQAPAVKTLPTFSFVAKEGGTHNLRLVPFQNSKVQNDFWWNLAPFQGDFNGDGFLDALYVGTMKAEYTVIAENTGGICGGGPCQGELAQPILFLGRADGSLRDASNLLVDNRPTSGHSSARQVLVADFNEDGRDDFFIADHGVGTHNGFRDSYFLSHPNGSWVESSNTHLSQDNYVIFDHGSTAGDIDNDGDIDIVNTNLDGSLTCWMNQGSGHMTKRSCGNIFAFAIELADMNGDGALDIVHAAHEFEGGPNSATGISYNNGRGSFGRTKRLAEIPEWGTVPELSVADLDGDGDQDIVLSRSRELYVGTAIEIKENLGNGQFGSQLFVLFDGPEGYRPVSEGNEWNNFVQAIRFLDQDNDADLDILLIANETGNSGNKVAGAILRNEGGFTFSHLPYGAPGNQVKRISSGAFIR